MVIGKKPKALRKNPTGTKNSVTNRDMSIVSISERMLTMSAEKKNAYEKKKTCGMYNHNSVNTRAVSSSTIGYRTEIGFEQERHLPHNKIQERTGILSCHAIFSWQCGHAERGVTGFCPLTNR